MKHFIRLKKSGGVGREEPDLFLCPYHEKVSGTGFLRFPDLQSRALSSTIFTNLIFSLF